MSLMILKTKTKYMHTGPPWQGFYSSEQIKNKTFLMPISKKNKTYSGTHDNTVQS